MSDKWSTILQIASSHLDQFTAFHGVLFFVRDSKTKIRSILLLFMLKMLFLTAIRDLSLKFSSMT